MLTSFDTPISLGSPPHTWGILKKSLSAKTWSRITPTYMGNTIFKGIYGMIIEDHPHIHGEYPIAFSNSSRKKGSPPHTWGILQRQPTRMRVLGITPTYMGNTGSVGRRQPRLEDHPHIHGEYRSLG